MSKRKTNKVVKKVSKKMSKSQDKLAKILKNIFPKYEHCYNYRGFDWLANPETKKDKQEIDIYIKDIKLAIEYDGKQHFKVSKKFGGKLGFYQTKVRDAKKNEKILNNSKDVKTFIRIPYWEKLTKENIYRILLENKVL